MLNRSDDKAQTSHTTILEKLHKADASKPTYAFAKPEDHFHEHKLISPMDEDPKHKLIRMRKTTKATGSKNRNEGEWVKLYNPSDMRPKNHDRFIAISIAAAEIYRFMIGNTQLKYRYEYDSAQNKTLVSKLGKPITDDTDFFTLSRQIIEASQEQKFPDEYCFEGIGRVTFCKLLLLENDFHFGNAFVNKDGYFVGIDHSQSFWPVTCGLFEFSEYSVFKKIYYTAITPNLTMNCLKKQTETQVATFLTDQPHEYIGSMQLEDFESLPLIQHFVPTNWEFMNEEIAPYTKFVSEHERARNERCLMALKALVTHHIIHLLLDLHLGSKDDKTNIQALYQKQINTLSDIGMQSRTVFYYVKKHRLLAMQAILYEMNDFLGENKHYQPKEHTDKENLWDFMTSKAIDAFSKLLTNLSLSPITEAEKCKLTEVCQGVQSQNNEVLGEIAAFYELQKMDYYSSRVYSIILANAASKESLPISDSQSTSIARPGNKIG